MRAGRILIFVVLAAAVVPLASGKDAAPPTDSLGDFAVFSVVQRYRLYADFCTAANPRMKKDYASFVRSLSERAQGAGEMLMKSEKYRDMKKQEVPAAIAQAMNTRLESEKQQLAAQDASQVCQTIYENLRGMPDTKLIAEVLTTFEAMRNASQPAAATE